MGPVDGGAKEEEDDEEEAEDEEEEEEIATFSLFSLCWMQTQNTKTQQLKQWTKTQLKHNQSKQPHSTNQTHPILELTSRMEKSSMYQ